ncbi:MAG: hypothetical protein ACOY0T_33835 [Myxococcota bacterium]
MKTAVAQSVGVAALALGSSACGESSPNAGAQRLEVQTLDARRSLAVTEQVILQRFPLKRVLDQLVSQSNVGGLGSKRLFQQWWDTQNPKPGSFAGPHCDDSVDPALGSVLNSFPYSCRPAPAEGVQSGCDPFAAGSACSYVPIGLFNRFDLAPENGAYCGEYRIVYAKESGIVDTGNRNLLIFEAAMPNPLPLLGLEGCRPLANFWANLSSIDDVNSRANLLEGFYFQGLLSVPPFPPVVHVANFGDNASGRGQVRTNQFVQSVIPRIWSLREFKLLRSCGLLGCSWMRFVPVTAKSSPYGPLFDPLLPHARSAGFQNLLAQQVPGLVGNTIFDLSMSLPDTYNSGQSQANGLETNYLSQFGIEASAFRGALTTALAAAGSSLTPENIVARVQALSCAGCHRISNAADLGEGMAWPSSLGFTHVTERETETVAGQARYVLSEALTQAFLPHRGEILQRYLDNTLLLKLIPTRPIGGFLVH